MRTFWSGLLLVLWSSTAAAQNTISASKSCYISGEGFVVTFKDVTPKVRDWIGIINASSNVNGVGVQYSQYVYTCGTINCNSIGPSSSTVSIFNGLPAGQYKAVLLRSDTFFPLAVSPSFTVAATCSAGGGTTPTTNSVTVGKSCYTSGEGVLATFTETAPKVGDRVGLIQASANLVGSVFYPAVVFTCGTFSCKFAPARGAVSIFNQLAPGKYKAVLLRANTFSPLAVSTNFTVANICPAPPTAPTTIAPVKPTAPVARSTISVARSCYKSRTVVVVSFFDVGAQRGDRVGLVNATVNVNAVPKFYPAVIFTCGTFNCTTAPTSGSVGMFQNFGPGRYKAVLLRGQQLFPLAVSANFTIAASCPGPAPTPTPGHSVSLSKSCYAPTESVIASFTDTDAVSGDSIGLVPASVDVEVFPVRYIAFIFTCGTSSCSGAPKSGTVGLFQNFAAGKYKAVLLRGNQFTPLALSANFTVSTTCP